MDDGGLSAILGVVTVKLHSDTIQALLNTKIDQADIPPEEKSKLKDYPKQNGRCRIGEIYRESHRRCYISANH